MEHGYFMHGHTRSFSSLASTIMPVTSDPSPFTSVTASPMESHDARDLPIELKVPLPASSTCSDQDEEKEKITVDSTRVSPKIHEEEVHSDQVESRPTDTTGDIVIGSAEPEETLDSPSVTLVELAQLVELETYEKHRALSAQDKLEHLRLSCGLDKRLVSTFSIAYGNMIDQYKTDDQAGFAGLYEACEQLKISCEIADPASKKPSLVSGEETVQSTALHTLSLKEQESILAFLTQIRTDQNFLSDRISQLSPAELTALTSSYHPAGIDFSILQNHSHGKSQYFSKDSQMMKLSRRMDNLHWFHNRDPFFALVYGVFDSSARPGSHECTRRIDIWSATCAKAMVEGFAGSKPGTDELAIASLDAFAHFQDWPLKPKMEVYLMGILTKGVTILEAPTSQCVNFKEPLETHNAKAAIADSNFFEDALLDLFDLLTTDDVQRAVPASAIAFAHAVLHRIEDPKLRARAQQFIVIRWYFATFISSIVVYPEVRGILMSQHIGETARRLILQKLVVRMQERVFDVILPWNNNALVNPNMRDKIMAIFQSFTPPLLSETNEVRSTALNEDDEASSRFLMLTPLDIVGIIQVLCPDDLSAQGPTDQASVVPLSDRPSTAGSSTLVAGSSDIGSVEISPAMVENTGDPGPNDKVLTEDVAKPRIASESKQGELKAQANLKEKPKRDADDQVRTVCQKLKKTSRLDPGTFTGASSDAWTLAYYSKDGSTLSMKPIGTNAPGGMSQESAAMSDHNNDPDSAIESRIYLTLKAAVLGLLHQESGPDGAILEDLMTSKHKRQQNPCQALEKLMEAALAKAHSSLDFESAHLWWRNLQAYRDFMAHRPTKAFHTLLQNISKDLQDAVECASRLTRYCDIQCRSLSRLQKHNKNILAKMGELRNTLRIKMWYVSDVRHSATYEEALYVTHALRTMAASRRSKQPGSISNWARQRLRGSNVHDRAEAQTLEAMVASKDHGGLSKLSDEQVELTSRWLTRKSIENFCKGEERIHRFCYEIQRSVGKIAGTSLLESPVLWSSNLFKRERASLSVKRSRANVLESPIYSPFDPSATIDPGRSNTSVLYAPAPSLRAGSAASARSPMNTFAGFWNPGYIPRQSTGLGLYGSQPILPPTPTSPQKSWSNYPYSPTSPVNIFTPPTPSRSNIGARNSSVKGEDESSPARIAFAEETKRKLCSLLISDLGYSLWNYGSETDAWVNEHIEDVKDGKEDSPAATRPMKPTFETADAAIVNPNEDATHHVASAASPGKALLARSMDAGSKSTSRCSSEIFSFPEAYSMLLRKMSLTHDPYYKLQLLYELENLIIKSIDISYSAAPGNSDSPRSARRYGEPSLRSRSVPRTKATSLEEVIANCTERRAGTLKSTASKAASALSIFGFSAAEPNLPGTDDIVNVFHSIFRERSLRSTTLFRDLQYIAAFIPAETLDKTAQGKAFWDAGLAALALKEDLCESMVNRANTITAYNISPHPTASADPTADNILTSTTLQDAANLWLITAKEGSPVAARELGLFYLTHPELLSRITAPFSKAKDVFKAVMANDNARGAGDRDRGALDPYTFAVVFHWMDVAANAGDKDARDFLKGNGELSRCR